VPELKSKFEAVRATELEVDNVILIKEERSSDLMAPYSVEEITQTDGSLIFKVKPTRSDVLGKTRYFVPGNSSYVVRRIA